MSNFIFFCLFSCISLSQPLFLFVCRVLFSNNNWKKIYDKLHCDVSIFLDIDWTLVAFLYRIIKPFWRKMYFLRRHWGVDNYRDNFFRFLSKFVFLLYVHWSNDWFENSWSVGLYWWYIFVDFMSCFLFFSLNCGVGDLKITNTSIIFKWNLNWPDWIYRVDKWALLLIYEVFRRARSRYEFLWSLVDLTFPFKMWQNKIRLLGLGYSTIVDHVSSNYLSKA